MWGIYYEGKVSEGFINDRRDIINPDEHAVEETFQVLNSLTFQRRMCSRKLVKESGERAKGVKPF